MIAGVLERRSLAKRPSEPTEGVPRAWLREERQDGVLRLLVAGDWTIAQAAQLDELLLKLDLGNASQVEIDASGVSNLDSVGAMFLLRLKEKLAHGRHLRAFKSPAGFQTLIDTLARTDEHKGPPPQPSAWNGLTAFLDHVGGATKRALGQGYVMLGYLGLVSHDALRTVVHPRRLRVVALLNQIERTGLRALPILGLLSFTMGIVLAYRGVDQLRRFGAELFTVNILGMERCAKSAC